MNGSFYRCGLSARTQQLVAEHFGGEIEEAQRVAGVYCATHAATRTPGWMLEVIGVQRTGWRDPMRWWTSR